MKWSKPLSSKGSGAIAEPTGRGAPTLASLITSLCLKSYLEGRWKLRRTLLSRNSLLRRQNLWWSCWHLPSPTRPFPGTRNPATLKRLSSPPLPRITILPSRCTIARKPLQSLTSKLCSLSSTSSQAPRSRSGPRWSWNARAGSTTRNSRPGSSATARTRMNRAAKTSARKSTLSSTLTTTTGASASRITSRWTTR